MSLTVLGLVAWILVYGCGKNKKNALYIILLVFFLFFVRLQRTDTALDI